MPSLRMTGLFAPGPDLLDQLLHAAQRLGTDVMFDPLGVDGGDPFGDADRPQKRQYGLVPLVRLSGQLLPAECERDWPIGLGLDQTVPLQTRDRAGDGDMADRETFCQVDDAAASALLDQFRDRLDVVLGGL